MRIEHFRYAFNRLNGFYLKEHIILFRKPLELWNEITGESITFKTLDEVLEYELAGEKVRAIIERTDTLYIPPLNGGRGAGDGTQKSFKFGHPSGGHFSDADLISTSMDARSKGIVATSTKAQYTFEKGTHFKATQFVKAVKNANMKGTSYDNAVDKWLKGNAKKYGYKYTKQK